MSVCWLCRCDCGKETIAHSSVLKSGKKKSCGCNTGKSISAALRIDLSGRRFGKLTAIEPVSVLCKSGSLVKWKCLCDCGATTLVSTNNLNTGKTRSCGCVKSFGEECVSGVLKSLHVSFLREYTFQDLKTPNGGSPRFDFALFDDDNNVLGLIEYQGRQHYEELPNSAFGKLQREVSDHVKRSYCFEKNIPLFEIRYDDDIEEAVTKLVHTLYGNPVPSPEPAGKV